MKIYYTTVKSPLGPLTLAASCDGLVQLAFGYPTDAFFEDLQRRIKMHLKTVPDWQSVSSEEHPILCEACIELERYFNGEPLHFKTPFAFIGTAFQISVWEVIKDIPYGQTCSYQDIGIEIGNPKGAQAIGQATGHNPIAILVPCHRVMGKNGSMTGFSAPGGIDTKRQLLELEGTLLKLF